MLQIAIEDDNVPHGNLCFDTSHMKILRRLDPGVISITRPGQPERARVERFIEQVFDREYGANLSAHYPTLMSLRNRQGDLMAAVGFRSAASHPLFLEQYLDAPVEAALSRSVGEDLPRHAIVEVGSLASLGRGASLPLIVALVAYLVDQGFDWLTITSTHSLRTGFAYLGLHGADLGAADPARLPDGGKAWGSYYETDPRVLAGSLRTASERLGQYLNTQTEDGAPSFFYPPSLFAERGPGMSWIINAIDRHAAEKPDAVALTGNGLSYSYRALRAEVETLASTLAGLSDSTGTLRPVALALDNGPAAVIADLALFRAEIPALSLPPFFTKAQSGHALATAGTVLMITDKPVEAPLMVLPLAGTTLYLEALDHPAATLPKGTSRITYTSGTTGTPKGVCLSETALEATAGAILDRFGAALAERHVAIMPLAVLLESVAGLYPILMAGGTYVAHAQETMGFRQSFRPDFAALVGMLKAEAATSVIMVPEILRGTMAVLGATGMRLPDLKLAAVGGSRVAPDLLVAAETLGLPAYEGYGLSEAGSVVAVNSPGDSTPGTVGRLLPHVSAHVADTGELILDTAPFLGYVGEPAWQGPYPTGDIVEMDAEGRLAIKGRSRNVIINSFGRNISPEWVEGELLAHPAIAQAVVYGEAKPSLGAVIVPSSAAVTPAAIAAAIEAANSKLPPYAQVQHWLPSAPFSVEAGTLTGTGRPRREIILKEKEPMIEQSYAEGNSAPASESFFNRLRRETADEQAYLMGAPLIQTGLQHGATRETYIAYLTQAYYHVRHTVPLMAAAKRRLPADAAVLHAALDEYIDEETGHEEWILNDIRNAGGNAEAVRHGTPAIETEMMVAFTYDYIERVNPVGFFGMVFVLEGTSTAIATDAAEKVMATLGLPKKCFSYLLSHGSLDLEHMKFFEGLMGKITDPDDQAAILHMAKRMFILFGNVLRAIPLETLEERHVA